MPASAKDNFPSVLIEDITMSAANTLTFSEVQVGLNLFDKVGLIMHRIEYFFGLATYDELAANADFVQIALTSSNSLGSLGSNERALIDKLEIDCIASGAPANLNIIQAPFVKDWSGLPGGGLLIPPKPLYVGMTSVGFAAAGTGYARMYFTLKKLSDADYLELVETFRFFQ